ncbi:MAG: hypothetical protein M1833_004993 [Piccolia ochrophora]|nr:MAG: hypothetical protein M1833_004993 [Piccolia ochrophora]
MSDSLVAPQRPSRGKKGVYYDSPPPASEFQLPLALVRYLWGDDLPPDARTGASMPSHSPRVAPLTTGVLTRNRPLSLQPTGIWGYTPDEETQRRGAQPARPRASLAVARPVVTPAVASPQSTPPVAPLASSLAVGSRSATLPVALPSAAPRPAPFATAPRPAPFALMAPPRTFPPPRINGSVVMTAEDQNAYEMRLLQARESRGASSRFVARGNNGNGGRGDWRGHRGGHPNGGFQHGNFPSCVRGQNNGF